MTELYFRGHPRFGKLDFVLNSFEGLPILFICKNENCDLFLCLASEIRGKFRYIVSLVTPNIIVDMIDKRASIKQSILSGKIFLLKSKQEGFSCKELTARTCNKKDLPKEDLYFIAEDKEATSSYKESLLPCENSITVSYEMGYIPFESYLQSTVKSKSYDVQSLYYNIACKNEKTALEQEIEIA